MLVDCTLVIERSLSAASSALSFSNPLLSAVLKSFWKVVDATAKTRAMKQIPVMIAARWGVQKPVATLSTLSSFNATASIGALVCSEDNPALSKVGRYDPDFTTIFRASFLPSFV